ncbi:MAG: DUF4428 domain-containing protein [Mobiluncus porci]|uniref:DUF4428 domain-containing protein n=1 Tax=Mobiluncus porci TaxID=2652278 RepID=UPI0023F53207|nr:DUF4428 domain-containing protein [Mobiluncus porci]MDD7541591.1 DUF4428 domain-containing protein [Mobiluncus porci]MDY5748576.1 DUF4428 domain-containing protein [Mobiluncus porci]
MGLFDSKECALCGEKAGMFTKQKLQDGFLCGDCKKKLSDLSSGWKERTISDVNEHLQLREANKEKSSQFQVSRAIGAGGSLEIDDAHGWFRFKIGRDYQQGNAQVFGFNELGNFYAEIHYDAYADDEDNDGVPDQFDPDSRDFNRNRNTMMGAMMGAGELNSQSANMFVQASGLAQYFRSIGSQINDAGMPAEVTDVTMVVGTTSRFWPEVRLRSAYFGSGGSDQQRLQDAQQTIQALMQIRGGAGGGVGMMAQPGMVPQQGMGMAQQGMMAQPGMVPQQGMGVAPQAATPAAPSLCPSCNAPVNGAFCPNCGTKLS